jgi:hypothetical protein
MESLLYHFGAASSVASSTDLQPKEPFIIISFTLRKCR